MSKPLVLITGATGHLGFATLRELLRSGYRARITYRNQASVDKIKQAPSVQPYVDELEFVEVPDILAPGAFDSAVQGGVEYILHLASPIVDMQGKLKGDIKEIYIDPAVQGTVGILESAAKSASVKRVVVTSSVVILTPPAPGQFSGPDDLAPLPDLNNLSTNPWLAYRDSKILAYDAAVKWTESHQPSFDVVYVLPSYTQGRNELVTRKEDVRNGSNDVMVDICLGGTTDFPRIANLVLVDDVARVQIAAMDPGRSKAGERFVAAYPRGFRWNDVPPLAAELFPDAVRMGILNPNGSWESVERNYDSSLTTTRFGIEFAGLREMVKSVVGQYVELAEKEGH